MTKTPPAPPPRRGAPRGNQNARKHGFYSQYFPPTDQQDLEQCELNGLDEEINMIRVYMRHIVQTAPKEPNFSEAVEIVRVLCMGTASLTRLMRAQKYLQGEQMNPNERALQEALDELVAEFSLGESSGAPEGGEGSRSTNDRDVRSSAAGLS